MKRIVFILLVLLLAGCQATTPAAPVEETEPVEAVSEDTVQPTDVPPTATAEPPKIPDMEFVVSGEPEIVFDWTTDRCEEEHIPDIAARAFRDADGMVQLTIGHLNTYRMIGPDLNTLTSDCSGPVNTSDLDPDPAMFNDGEWIGSLYTEDGQTIYAMVHNEYRGHLHPEARPGQCPSGDYLTCLDTSITMAISTDGGDSFHDIAAAPNHLVASMPYPFNDQGVPTGLRQPSNILKGKDGYFYVFSNISDYPENPADFPHQWVCLMRTDNLDDPSSWRYWDGNDFNGAFSNPYVDPVGPDTPKCAELDFANISGSMTDSVTYSTVLDKYVLVGFAHHPSDPDPMWGVYYSLSDDLINWSLRKLLFELPMVASVADPGTELIYAYPVLLDPDSTSLNFDTTDDAAYIYVSRFNFGGGSLDRDLLRYPVALVPITYETPQWEFETDGDVEGWLVENHIESFTATAGSLSMQSSGDDPYMVSPPVELRADDARELHITMRVSAGDATEGQLFFVTTTDSVWDDPKSLLFDVRGDGEFHTYRLRVGALDSWSGVITQLRLDPIWGERRTIEIDSITFTN